MFGKGGNLCKCNAVHFAGKRARNIPMARNIPVARDIPLMSSSELFGPEDSMSSMPISEELSEFYSSESDVPSLSALLENSQRIR